MYGAILGDMIGAPFEFDRGKKSKKFKIFSNKSEFTDDSVMTIAVAEALMDTMGKSDDEIRSALITSMRKWGKRYPYAGYGGRFAGWLRSADPKPYGSFGNGSAMRASSVGWLFESIEETRRKARLTADVTHNHPEGIKGAEATASAIFMARTGHSKQEIKQYIIREFGYDLTRTCDEIRPKYHHVESCQETVPEAITAFLEGNDFEDVIRTAVSLGGDCDTLTCIAGGIAEAFYGVSEEMIGECRKRMPEDMLAVLDRFLQVSKSRVPSDPFLIGNEQIESAIRKYHADSNKKTLIGVMNTIRERMHADGHFIFPVQAGDNGEFSFRALKEKDGKIWNVAFTSQTEFSKGEPSQVLSHFIDSTLKGSLSTETAGFIINPWGQSFMLTKELIDMIIKADGDVEYTIPDDKITAELLADGSFLKRAITICNRNKTQLNVFKLLRILRDSNVWIPCNAIMSEADYENMSKLIKEAEEKGGLESLIGRQLTNQDNIRMVPDILQRGDEFFFPVFTTVEEMGEYGDGFSKIERHFLEAVNLAKNNERKLNGIVINAYTDAFVLPMEICDLIFKMESSLEIE